jgi:hypothetical protein
MAGFARSVAVATGLCQTGGGLERANPWRRGGAKPTGLAGRESAGLPKAGTWTTGRSGSGPGGRRFFGGDGSEGGVGQSGDP